MSLEKLDYGQGKTRARETHDSLVALALVLVAALLSAVGALALLIWWLA